MYRLILLAITLFAIALLSGCGESTLPDLSLVQSSSGILSSCNNVDFVTTPTGGQLSNIQIKNNGIDAPASTAAINFTGGDVMEIAIPFIPSGGTFTLSPVDVPRACLSGTCFVTVTVDFPGVISESNEENNTAQCEIPG